MLYRPKISVRIGPDFRIGLMDGWMYTAVVSRSNDNGDLGRGSRLSRVLFGAKGKEKRVALYPGRPVGAVSCTSCASVPLAACNDDDAR